MSQSRPARPGRERVHCARPCGPAGHRAVSIFPLGASPPFSPSLPSPARPFGSLPFHLTPTLACWAVQLAGRCSRSAPRCCLRPSSSPRSAEEEQPRQLCAWCVSCAPNCAAACPSARAVPPLTSVFCAMRAPRTRGRRALGLHAPQSLLPDAVADFQVVVRETRHPQGAHSLFLLSLPSWLPTTLTPPS